MAKKQFKPLELFKTYIEITGRSIRLLLADKKSLFLGYIFITVLLAVANFINPAVIALIINKLQAVIQGTSTLENINGYAFVLILIYVIPFFIYPLNDYYDSLIRFYLIQIMEMRVLRKWTELDAALREDPKLHDLFYSVRNQGINKLYNFTTRNIAILSNIVQLIISSIVIIQFNWFLFLVFCVFIIPNLLINIRYSHKVWGIWHSETPSRRVWAVLWDLMYRRDNLQEIRINHTGPKLLTKMQGIYDSFFAERSSVEKKKLRAQTLSLILSQGASVLIYFILIKQVISQEIAIGTFTFYISSLTIFKNSVSLFVGYISNQYQDTLVVKQLFYFFDLKNIITTKIDAPKVSIKAPLIEFKNVSFHYPQNSTLIFKNLNLTINPGEKIAIVGLNGAGKSSLMKLLLRFYDVVEGEILVNGINIKDIDLESYYDLIGVLFQDYINYQFLVKDAIAAATLDEVANIDLAIKSAKESGAGNFIEQYGEQYETQLGKEFEKGIDPSVGQWQKLAMARTFYKNPKMYILDEPTASIDAEAEEKIFESVEALPDDITVILISHRFSTVRRADKIIVLEDGKILEQGTHELLMKNQGRYYDLFTMQAKGYQ